jgi:signal transduction histidine kinase/DNA-binding response OmpR family regulator
MQTHAPNNRPAQFVDLHFASPLANPALSLRTERGRLPIGSKPNVRCPLIAGTRSRYLMEQQKTPKPQEIMVVEDTPASLHFLVDLLNEAGFFVRPASSGSLALRSAAARQPDLILLDVKMPQMDGYQVCRRLKAMEQTRNIPVLFISALADTADKVKGFNAGGVDYIAKPFQPQEVLVRIRLHLRLRELTEHLELEVNQRTAELTLANQQLVQEITERRRVEMELSRESDVNLATAELSQQLLSPAPVDDIAYRVLEHAKRITGSPHGYVGYIDSQTGYLVCPTLTRDVWDECRVSNKTVIFKEFGHLWGWGLENRRPLLTNTPADDPRSSGTPPGHVPIRRFLSAPALIGETLVGQVAVANADDDYADRELDVMERLAGLYAIAIQRQRADEELDRHRGHLQELVEERTAELEATNRELEGFSYSVSHDLRAPLRHIDGFVELLRRQIESALDEKGRHYMDAISGAARKMGMLIDDLLAFSRMGRHDLTLQKVDLAHLVRDAIEELEPDAAGRNIAWRVSDLPTVMGDAAILRMVLVNLISNALKFTCPRQQAHIEIGSQPGRDSETVIFVRDNGVGFNMAHADKLFGVFQRLHSVERFEGTGIGLANVRRMIAKHGGRTWAEGKVDRGAVFYFSLPRTA